MTAKPKQADLFGPTIPADQALPRTLLISAPDELRKRRLVDIYKERLAKSGHADVSRYEAGSFDAATLDRIRGDLASNSLFASERLVLVRGCEKMPAKTAEKLLPVLEHPGSAYVLLLAGEIVATHALTKHFKSRKALMQFQELKGEALTAWIQHEAKQHGLAKLPGEAVRLLAEIHADDLDSLDSDLGRLAAYSNDGTISPKEVETLLHAQNPVSEFAFIDAIGERNQQKASILCAELLGQGKNPFGMLALITKTFGQYYAIRTLQNQRLEPAQIGTELGINGWLLSKHMKAVKDRSANSLERCFFALVRADSKLKNRSIGPEGIFSELVRELVS